VNALAGRSAVELVAEASHGQHVLGLVRIGFDLLTPQPAFTWGRHFNVGLIAKDQVERYARRMGEAVAEAAPWLPPRTSRTIQIELDAPSSSDAAIAAGGRVRGRPGVVFHHHGR
jgi:hypothetical protein